MTAGIVSISWFFSLLHRTTRVLFFNLYGDCVGKILIPGNHFRKVAETFSTLPEYRFLDP